MMTGNHTEKLEKQPTFGERALPISFDSPPQPLPPTLARFLTELEQRKALFFPKF